MAPAVKGAASVLGRTPLLPLPFPPPSLPSILKAQYLRTSSMHAAHYARAHTRTRAGMRTRTRGTCEPKHWDSNELTPNGYLPLGNYARANCISIG